MCEELDWDLSTDPSPPRVISPRVIIVISIQLLAHHEQIPVWSGIPYQLKFPNGVSVANNKRTIAGARNTAAITSASAHVLKLVLSSACEIACHPFMCESGLALLSCISLKSNIFSYTHHTPYFACAGVCLMASRFAVKEWGLVILLMSKSLSRDLPVSVYCLILVFHYSYINAYVIYVFVLYE